MTILNFSKLLELRANAQARAEKITPMIQERIPAEWRLPDNAVEKLLFDSSYELQLAHAKSKGELDAGD